MVVRAKGISLRGFFSMSAILPVIWRRGGITEKSPYPVRLLCSGLDLTLDGVLVEH